jgi:NAD(P)-dependent dehydrogenase (short-subunit alcohol dehydrogenase family)
MTERLDNMTAVVIGGSSGIGAATARRFASAGARVLVNGRDAQKVARVAQEIGGEPAVADGSDRAQLDALFAQAGEVDHLVISASGGQGMGALAGLDPAVLAHAFEAKFWVHFNVLQAALDHLAPEASITLVTAASARAALPQTAGLAAINGALQAMVPPLAAELAPRRVNAVSPGAVRTPWWNGASEAVFEQLGAMVALGRVAEADEIAAVIFAVATSGYMTGSVIDVDGGAHLSAAGHAIR